MRISIKLLPLITLAFYSCQPASRDNTPAADVPKLSKAITAENYLSGKKFCETYKDDMTSEISKYVSVPHYYKSDSSQEKLEIYTYTTKAFDPAKPTVIFLDGGPGQNTHTLRESIPGDFNQINFDQRGLGCSAPETFELYKKADLYSTENTVNDIDMIRKAYNLEKVSVYGVSYGTVPATIYGAKFFQVARSVILEGTVGPLENIHSDSYKVDKLNLAIADLNKEQKVALEKGLNEKNEDVKNLVIYMNQLFYSNAGMQRAKTDLFAKFFNTDGSINEEYAKKLKEYLKEDAKYKYEQQPGGVDENIYTIISCRDLNVTGRRETYIKFSAQKGFFTRVDDDYKEDSIKYCEEQGVKMKDIAPYEYTQHKVSAPTYYFQGSHDGATQPEGAFAHWKFNNNTSAYFMLMQKGGHNPYISQTRLAKEEKNESKKNIQKLNFGLMVNAVNAAPITLEYINKVNATDAKFKWKLYLHEDASKDDWKKELEGIKEYLRKKLEI
jgi:proline iminopeptidase